MPTHEQLMERLAAADPLPDTERLTPHERQEADELLSRLLATPAEPARHAPARGPRRRWAFAAAAATCTALVAFAAVNVVDSDGPGPNVLALAVAAVTDRASVYHVVERNELHATDVRAPAEGRRIWFESWHAADGRFHQRAFAPGGEHRGRLIGEYAGRRTPGRRGGPMLSWYARNNTITSIRIGFSEGHGAPFLNQFADPGTQLRSLEEQGRLHAAGTTEVDGRRAYRLASDTVPGWGPRGKERIEFLVDAETYLPLASRYTHSNGNHRYVMFTRYVVYARLPLNARSRAKLDLDPHPGARCAPGADKIMGRGTLGFPNPCAR
jgi:hypothetical protein